jgi:type I restriction enzyme S subunit
VGQSPPGTSYNTAGSGVPLINGPDEFGGADAFAETRATKFTTEPTKMCRKGDLILCVRGSTTGRMNIAAHDACVGRGVVAIRSSDYQQWLKYFISFSRQAIYRLGSGSTFPNVSSAQLKDVVVPIPPRAEQARIIDHLTALRTDIRRLEELFRSKFLMAQRLKHSLLYKAFSGELTSRGSAFAKDAAE